MSSMDWGAGDVTHHPDNKANVHANTTRPVLLITLACGSSGGGGEGGGGIRGSL